MRRKPSDHRALLASTVLLVRSGRATSRSALAKSLEASASTLGLYVDQLTAMGYMHETGLSNTHVGRPQRLLGLRAEAGWFAGVEFNASASRSQPSTSPEKSSPPRPSRCRRSRTCLT